MRSFDELLWTFGDRSFVPHELLQSGAKIEAPVLLIWAPNGGNLEIMNPEYHRLAGGPASIWRIDVRYSSSFRLSPAPSEPWSRVRLLVT